MQNPKAPQIFFFTYSSFIAISAILLLGEVVLSPSEPRNALFLGLSLPRLVLASGLFTASLLFVFLSFRATIDQAWAERVLEQWFGKGRLRPLTIWLAGLSFGIGWIGCFLPFYRAGILAIHWERMRPAMIFLLLAGFATLAVIFLKQSNFSFQKLRLSNTYKSSLILFVSSILLIGIMLYTGFGVYAPEDYWYGAGVPILVTQLTTAILGGVLFLQTGKIWSSKRFDLIVFLLIYIVSAVLWAREPLQRSFLFIGPYPPNRVLYTFADAALYDTASQFALIGQNFLFYNGPFFERALYASFLTFLHSLVGQDYEQLMAAQAAMFAVFPALVYLVGKSLNNRAIGFAAALIAMFRGANAIAASNMIDMANTKMMLTDFPTAIGMILVLLLALEWLKHPQQKWHYALWMGGVMGLAIMLRTNALFILLFIPLFSLVELKWNWKAWVTSSILIMLAVLATTLPWELRNQSLGGQMYSSFLTKFEEVIQQRYRSPAQPDALLPQENIVSLVLLKQTQALFTFFDDTSKIQEPSCQSTICFVPNHFLHNILTSILVLPTSPVLDDLRHTVKESHQYWRQDWNGTFAGTSFLFFALNLFLIVLGIRVAWEQHRLSGLAALALFMVYNLSNAFARTSGGRYIVPIDWIVTIYFLMGAFQIISLVVGMLGIRWTLFPETIKRGTPKQKFTRNDLAWTAIILAILFAVGALIPLAERVQPSRYQNYDVSRALLEHEEQIVSAGLSLEEINSFLQNPNADISVGRALYPRYYIEFEGEVHFYPVVVMGFPRATFTLIGPHGEKGIVLPGEKPRYFPHAVDTIVLGCKEQLYVDALAVIILDENGAVYTRSPESPLQCPLKQPVCDNNHNCY